MGTIKTTMEDTVVVVRGGGDLATGVVQKLYHAGFKVVVLETARPLAIRRTVALCNAVFQGVQKVEDLKGVLVNSWQECAACWQQNQIPLLIDTHAESLTLLKPSVVVDEILAKRNLGTKSTLAPVTIALGPGFSAPEEVDVVVETMRGHYLGRLYFQGQALPNTGIPGEIGGKSAERVIHAPTAGKIRHLKRIGAVVQQGEPLFYIDQDLVTSPLNGVLRGLISDQVICTKGLKCGDVDPRSPQVVDCFTISDKARALGGAVLEAVLFLGKKKRALLTIFKQQ